MTDIPERVRVGYRTYSIEPLPPAGPLAANHATGACGYDEGIIQIDLSVDEEMQAQVLLHEIIHACWRLTSLPEEQEERVVSMLTHALAQVMQDNPKVISWIDKNLRSKLSKSNPKP